MRKRVASHFGAGGNGPGHDRRGRRVEHIESVVVASEAEALLAEQAFIKQYRPRFNIRLRDDKSYPFIAISLDEDFPRVYFTRERHRPDRAYFGPYSNAKRVRETLDLLAKVFLFRSCTGAEPGRRSGSPCLDYHINRCAAPCVGYVSREEYRHGIDGVVDFLAGRYGKIERELEERMAAAAAAQEFEQAAVERNRLARCARCSSASASPNAPSGRSTRSPSRSPAATPTRRSSRCATACSPTASPSISPTRPSATSAEVAEEFLLQYYGGATSIPALVVVQPSRRDRDVARRRARRRRARGPVEVRASERGEKRRILQLAARNAALALEEEQLPSERRRQHRARRSTGCSAALGLRAVPMRIECFDISNLGGTHTVASMVVFEGGAPKHSDYRRFRIRTVEGSDDFASMAEVLGRRYAQWERQSDTSPHDPAYDASFAALPNLIVIDGGKGQLSAGLEPLAGFASAASR